MDRSFRHWVVAACAFVVALGLACGPVGAATPVAVTGDVPSSVTLTDNCTNPSAFDFGSLFPNDKVTTATNANVCSFDFLSNNDSSMLRVSQADHSGAAMTRDSATFLQDAAPTKRHTAVAASPVTTADAWAGGNDGKVWRTTDGGATWNPVAGATGQVSDISASSDTNVWLSTTNNELLHSTDGGLTWSAPATMPPVATAWESIEAFAGNVVIAVGDQGMFRSVDAGANWSEVVPPTVPSGNPYSWVDAKGAVVWALSQTGEVAISTDAGATWSTAAASPCGCIMDSVTVIDANTAFVTQGDVVYRTTDGGASFPVAFNTTPEKGEPIDSIKATDATHAWVTTDHGHVLRTLDGQTWNRVDAKTGNKLRSLEIRGANFYAVGNGMTRVRSGDGVNWTLQNTGGVDWSGVTAPDATHAWVAGGAGTVKVTTDSGATWTPQASSTTANLRAISAASATAVWAVGEGGVVIRTTNGGASWTTRPSPTALDLQAVNAVDASTAFVVGDGGSIYVTSDGGATWTNHSQGTTNYHGVDSLDALNLLVVGDDGRILHSLDGGATWSSQSVGAYSLKGVSMASDKVAWIAADQGDPFETTDGGASWIQAFNPIPGNDLGVAAIDDQTAYYATTARRARTKDGGFTWQSDGPSGGGEYAVAAFDANTAYIVGEGGMIHSIEPDASVGDFGGPVGWTSDNTGGFGMCIQGVGAGTSVAAPYVADTTPGASPVCTTTDADPWKPVPQAATKLAYVSTPGVSGHVDLVWGLRVGAQTAPGTYIATILVEAIAPNV